MGFQLKPLSQRLGKATHINRGPVQARQTTLNGRQLILFKCGIGRKKAVDRVMKALETFEPEAVIFVGLAGSLRPEFKVGDPFVVSSASQWQSKSETLSLDQALRLQDTYQNNETPIIKRIKGGNRIRRARLLTVDAFVNTVREKRRLGTAGFDIVDMEFGAIASAMDWDEIPLSGLLTISDSLTHNFPSFSLTTDEDLKKVPPPRLMVNSFRACKILGGFAHLWIKSYLH